MDTITEIIFISSLLLLLSILLSPISSRFGIPILLVFLILGMIAGEDGIGGIEFNNHYVAYLIGCVALAVILFEGGLRTPAATFRLAILPSALLATFGVVINGIVIGLIARCLLDFSWLQGLLIGAMLSSTDPAAIFSSMRTCNLVLKKHITATLEVESGINDPIVILMTLILIDLLMQPDHVSIGKAVYHFISEMVGGAVIGILGGYIGIYLINKLRIASGLYPVLAIAFALLIFSLAQLINASGFLAIYITGVMLGQQQGEVISIIKGFHDGLAWLCQIVLFIMLGLLVTPSKLLHFLWPALIIALGLILIARPIAVWLCLLPFKFTWQEKAFITWVGLRGAVPIYLASIPVLKGLPDAMSYFSLVFIVVLFSLLTQGWSVSLGARILNLTK